MTNRFKQFGPWLLSFGLVLALVFASDTLFAQNIISGEIDGVVTDSTGAVLPNAKITLTQKELGITQTSTTGSTGSFRFPLLRPGRYTVDIEAPGFAKVTQTAVVALGQATNVPVTLSAAGTTTTVEVTGATPLLQTENANVTANVNPTQVELMPNPGGDITNYALTMPGVTLSTGAGYGNFTSYGLPGTSNLYTVNGNDMNDPFNNLNNSGSSNNMLGVNEVQEVTLVNNGYTGQYGRGAGANMTITTKSGSNSFHGNARWDWNGRYLNANDWFNNATDTPRPFANSNEWGGSIGGPIKKNKLFFFYDNEGLRYVLPAGGFPVYIPTTAWATAIQANINATQPAQSAFYQKMFQLYASAPGSSAATPLTGDGGCGDFSGKSIGGVVFGTGGLPCTQTFRTSVNNFNKEMLNTVRVDLEATSKDRLSFRYNQDTGTQPTFTDPINSAFNALSNQPQYGGQMSWTHVVNPNVVNQFIASGFYYSAVFGPPNLAATTAVFPTTIGGNQQGGNNCTAFDGNLSCMGGEVWRYPQGRNVAQYQFVDDLSWTKGRHGLKFGGNFRRVNLSNFQPAALQTGLINLSSITDFVNGTESNAGGSFFQQQFAAATHYPVSNYTLGLYAQDEWNVTSRLKLTLALRVDRNSNLSCGKNCFSRFANNFASLSHDINIPYNQAILANQAQVFPSIQGAVWQPRLGFAYTPWGSGTVIRGGVGLFSDLYPAQVSSNLITNPPLVSIFTVNPTAAMPTPIPFAPNAPNSVFVQAAASNAVFQNQFANGGTLASIKAAVPGFSVPNFYATAQNIKDPRYLEWNFAIEQSIGNRTALTLNYVGNHGSDLFVINNGTNAFSRGGFQDLPLIAPDPRFGRVRLLYNPGISNYNGLTATLSQRVWHGFQGSISYTWSHSLDDISNAGFDPYSFNTAGESLRYQINPVNLRSINYGNSDYDFRQNLSANYVWELPFKSSHGFLNQVVGGWVVSGVIYKRVGQPYSVVNTSLPSSAMKNNGGGYVLANFLGGNIPGCTVSGDQINNPFQCLSPAQFVGPNNPVAALQTQSVFGNVARNSFRGPGFFNSDLSIKKNFKITESGLTFTMGANAYNVLNHPHFANPDNSVTSGTLGQVQSTVVPASSPYGNFQGSAVSGRVLQLELGIKF